MKVWVLIILTFSSFISYSQLVIEKYDGSNYNLLSKEISNNSILIMVLGQNTNTLEDDKFLLIEFDSNQVEVASYNMEIIGVKYEEDITTFTIKTNNDSRFLIVMGTKDKYVSLLNESGYTIYTGNVFYN